MFENMSKEEARGAMLQAAGEYYERYMKQDGAFAPGDRIAYAGRVFDAEEVQNLVDSALEFWLTAGRWTDAFEAGLAAYLGAKHCTLVNSGSSANLLAFMALTSPLLGERRLLPGDEVITVACGFPTTVAPILQYGAVPVFVDITIPQYNLDASRLEEARSPKTKAVMAAHTLGNPFDIAAVKAFCDKHGLWLIEDNCDALGSEYTLGGERRLTGTFGHIGTSSFYPPHHMTMGEGGAVYTNDGLLHKIIRSMRDWGRDCVCPSGRDNVCGRRFEGQHGALPAGYDHKYVYSHFGYNLKATDMQAAIGVAQLKKLPGFVQRRRHNFERLYAALAAADAGYILPAACPSSSPSWFGFLLTCPEGISRTAVTQRLEKANIQTRTLFAGNLVKHPCFDGLRKAQTGYRVVGGLTNTDRVMNHAFWVGVYPGMTDEMVDYMAQQISACAHATTR